MQTPLSTPPSRKLHALSNSQAPRDPAAGARNLLLNCAGVRSGDSVLLILESEDNHHYDPALAPFIAHHARGLGADVKVMIVAPGGGPEDIPAPVMNAIGAASHTIFLNRIGDQLRFAPLPGRGSKTILYALDMEFLGSYFAVSPYPIWQSVQSRLVAQLDAARRYSIRCPRGTDLTMDVGAQGNGCNRVGGFTVNNFPIMIVPPIPAGGLSGKLVLTQTLTSTYVHSYEDCVVPLRTPLTLTVEKGNILGFDGDSDLVTKCEAQFSRVSKLFGGPQWAINSWHAGINPFTYFPRPALSDIDRWSCVVFGSPRYAHFHMCGSTPGDICGQIFDPTIAFDDAVLWRNGHAAFLTSEEKQQLAAHSGVSPDDFETHREIGVQ